MSAPDPARLAALARRLGLSPRALVLAAARLAREPAVDRARVRAIVRASRRAAGCTAARLLATPIADFAHDEVDRALAGLWPAR